MSLAALPSFTVLRSPAWPALQRRLDSSVALQPRLASARDNLLRPIWLLEAMAADAPRALGDGVLEADRLRTLLYLAWPFATLTNDALVGVDVLVHGDLVHTISQVDAEPGVLDLGALMVVALGALRVAPAPKLGVTFLRTLHGLALAASAAEVLGRLDPKLPDAGVMGTVLDTLYLLEAVARSADISLLRPFALDPVERARWTCLQHLLGPESELLPSESAQFPWSGSRSHLIRDVQPAGAGPGEALTVHIDDASEVDLQHGSRVVFCAADRDPVAAELTELNGSADEDARILVIVPAGVAPGWIGLSDDARIVESNQRRAELREQLRNAGEKHACLRQAPVPVDFIPDIGVPDPDRPGQRLATAPRLGRNRYHGGAEPASSSVRIVLLRPAVIEADRTIEPIDANQARIAIARASLDELGQPASIYEPPWLTDDLAALEELPTTESDPALGRMLDRMARAALLSPGLEDAVWLLLLPQSEHAEHDALARCESAAAARAVAVVNRSGLRRALRTASQSRWEVTPPSRHLSVAASFVHGDLVLDHVREEERRRAVSGGFETGYTAIALDRAGRPLESTVIRGCSQGAALLSALVPVSSAVAVVEIRGGDEAVHRIARTRGALSLSASSLDLSKRTMRWSYAQTEGARPRVVLAVRRQGIDTPAFEVDPCQAQPVLPLGRLGQADALVLQASDGWGTAVFEIGGSKLDHDAPVVLRQLRDRRFWADVPRDWTVHWYLDDRSRGTARVIELGARDEGLLRLEASGKERRGADQRRILRVQT